MLLLGGGSFNPWRWDSQSRGQHPLPSILGGLVCDSSSTEGANADDGPLVDMVIPGAPGVRAFTSILPVGWDHAGPEMSTR